MMDKDADAANWQSRKARLSFRTQIVHESAKTRVSAVLRKPASSSQKHFLLGKNYVCVLNKSPPEED
jgi:hypothetical protein